MTLSAIDNTLVTVGQPCEGGACWTSLAASPTLPTDASTSMSGMTGFESLGELTDNGFTESLSMASTEHKGWHGTTLLTSVDAATGKYKAEFAEVSRGTVAKVRYGASNVTVNADGVVTQIDDKLATGGAVPLVFDELESNGWLRRTVVKQARVTSIDDVAHKKGSLIVYGMEFTVNSPSDGSAAIVVYRAAPAGSTPEPEETPAAG